MAIEKAGFVKKAADEMLGHPELGALLGFISEAKKCLPPGDEGVIAGQRLEEAAMWAGNGWTRNGAFEGGKNG